jgi:hypothetical protein
MFYQKKKSSVDSSFPQDEHVEEVNIVRERQEN